MSQTLFAILAMFLATLYSFNQQQTILREYDEMVKGELEIMSGGVALQVMEKIAGHPFDAHTGHPDFILTSDFDKKKLAEPGFQYEYTYGEAQYLEHFHGTEADIEFLAGENEFSFRVEVEVYYVDKNGKRKNKKTTTKEVIVTVYHDRLPTYVAQLKRTFSPTADSKDRETI